MTAEETVDVIVLGGGGSGLAAAASAAQAGARTVVLEKQPALGGTTALAVGSITGACTAMQARAGIGDSIAAFREDMDAFTGDLVPRDNPSLRDMLARQSGPTIDWLEAIGVPFAGPYPEPPHRVSRMHNVVPGPRLLIAKLLESGLRSGMTVHTGCEATRLVTGPGGAVTGVEFRQAGATRTISVRRGVILATGDFSGNAGMRMSNLSPAASSATPINPNNIGDGHRLAFEVGAVPRNMDVVFGPQMRFPRSQIAGITERLPTWTWFGRLGAQFMMHAPSWMLKPLVTSLMVANMSPSEELFAQGALLVDIEGNPLDTVKPTIAVAGAPEGKAYIILDERIRRQFNSYPYFISTAPGIAYAYFDDYRRGRPDLVREASSLQSLAAATGMTPERLGAAGAALRQGPYFALGPVLAALTTTEGSVDVDESCRVLDATRRPIDGLYAVGCVGQGGMMLRGHGMHYAWIMTSGRVAGQSAAVA